MRRGFDLKVTFDFDDSNDASYDAKDGKVAMVDGDAEYIIGLTSQEQHEFAMLCLSKVAGALLQRNLQ